MCISDRLTADKDAALPDVLVVKLNNPTRAGYDQVLKQVSDGLGFYGGQLSADVFGRWHVSIEDPAEKWRLQGEWHADAEEPLHLAARSGK